MLDTIKTPLRLGVAGLLSLSLAASGPAVAGSGHTQTAETQAALTPQAALQMLKDGNERFVKGMATDRDLLKQVMTTSTGQYPFGVVLGCIDSRVPPEIVFDLGIGDIFSPRIAGNFANVDILGSMEFATAAAGSKVIVVLGHTSCGAVKGATDGVELGNLTAMLDQLDPALAAVKDVKGERNSKNAEFVQAVAEANVRLTIQEILDESPVMKGLVDEGKLLVVGAMHDINTGQVHWMDSAAKTQY